MPRKLDIIEDLGNDLIDENAKVLAVGYKASLNRLQGELIIKTEKGITPTLKAVKTKISTTRVNITTRSAYVMGQVQLFILDPKNPKYATIKKLSKIYSVNNPRLFAVKLVKLSSNNVSPIRLTSKEKQASRLVNKIIEDNRKSIQQLVDKNTKALRRINKSITTNQSKAVIKARRRLINERIEVNGVKRPLTNEEISKRLRAEFRNDNARLERILDTETHRQNELVKEVVARDDGKLFKIWNTQRDSRVRSTHAKLDRKRIRIKSMFNVGGFKAPHPSSALLPPQESIRCRCFLTFE